MIESPAGVEGLPPVAPASGLRTALSAFVTVATTVLTGSVEEVAVETALAMFWEVGVPVLIVATVVVAFSAMSFVRDSVALARAEVMGAVTLVTIWVAVVLVSLATVVGWLSTVPRESLAACVVPDAVVNRVGATLRAPVSVLASTAESLADPAEEVPELWPMGRVRLG